MARAAGAACACGGCACGVCAAGATGAGAAGARRARRARARFRRTTCAAGVTGADVACARWVPATVLLSVAGLKVSGRLPSETRIHVVRLRCASRYGAHSIQFARKYVMARRLLRRPRGRRPASADGPESDEMGTLSLVKCAECLLLPTTRVLLGMRRAAARECRGLLLSMRAASAYVRRAGARRVRVCGEGARAEKANFS